MSVTLDLASRRQTQKLCVQTAAWKWLVPLAPFPTLPAPQPEGSCCKAEPEIKRVTGILWGLLVSPNLHNKRSEIRYERSVTVMMV